MKFTTNNLNLNVVKGAVPVRTALPALEGFYIKADDCGIHLIASSIEHEIHMDVEGEVFEEGAVVLDAKLLSGIVSSLKDELTFETVGNECIVSCGKKNYKLPIIPPDSFPMGKYDDFSESIEIPNFRHLVDNTTFAISSNETTNHTMTALCLNTNGSMAGLENFRIAVNYFEGNGKDKELLIPAKHLKNVPDSVKLSYNDKAVKIEGDGYTSYILLLDGKFFDYAKMLHTNDTTVIKVNREEYIAALKTLSLFISTDRKPVVHTIKDSLNLDVISISGKGNEEIEIERTGEDLEIGFNPKYLIDALSHIDDDVVTIRFSDAKSPALIDGENYKHLLLPVSYR